MIKNRIPLKNNSSVKASRRKFLKQSAGFTFMIGASGLISACGTNGPNKASASSRSDPMQANIWVTINPDDTIIVKYAGTEMGQGSMTHVPMMLAEYLDADWDKVTVEIVTIHDTAYGNPIFQNMLYTAGSTHVMVYSKKMKVAGTQARKLLMAAVAKHWDVPLSELGTDIGNVIHKSSGRRISYGNIVADVDLSSDIPDINDSDFIPEAKFRYIGKQVMRRDVPAKVNGKAQYGMDVQVPGMLYAAILRTPVEGERPLKVDDILARGTRGVTDIVILPYGVAVVAGTVEATKKGKRRLKVTWSEDSPFRQASTKASIAEYSSAAKDLNKTGIAWFSKGDSKGAIDKAENVLSAIYTSDPLYHAQMEPLNATASVSDDGKSAEIWVGTQTQSLTIIGAAETLQTTNDKITLHPLTMGGGFGRRSLLHQEYVDDALYQRPF
ncbi:Isoquinoline 1-oxidoreductase beta subunit [hydrothermal vent metagenome]|uniref:Isoquinoline 1-oxidoreductase beta subunit n=1 Tax=hydrothermal vent metagenome TaxID=652676 RepID=A0A3B0S929_9ZZZZ